MNEPINVWTDLDEWFAANLLEADPVLTRCLERAAAAGLVDHNVAPLQGALLSILVRSAGARRVLEIGTLAAYSTIWLARAVVPGGEVVTLEVDPAHAEVARANIADAGLEERVRLEVGPATQTLERFSDAEGDRFGFVFIDADKENNPVYFEHALRLTGPGALIVVDNVVRGGATLDAGTSDRRVQGVRSLVSMLAADARVEATAIQTVGSKGYDGFLIARVR